MSRKDEILEELARIKAVEKWPKRLATLRKRTGKKEADFCRDHDLPISGFNRAKTLERVPTKETFEKVEAALVAEGV